MPTDGTYETIVTGWIHWFETLEHRVPW
jgi:hypothetical protein